MGAGRWRPARDDVTVWHPRNDDGGKPVPIKHPSTPTPPASWGDPGATAIFTPDCPVPDQVNGIAMTPWNPPGAVAGWEALAGDMNFTEPPFLCPAGLKPAAGAVVLEADGRIWLVEPTNRFGGYRYSVPKGRCDNRSLKATALVEVFEESGLQIKLNSFLIDVPRSLTFTRYYFGHRIGGRPADMGWESQGAVLVPLAHLPTLLNGPFDVPLVKAIAERLGR